MAQILPRMLELIEDCLIDFITEFQLNPFNYLYESDIRARIFSKCFDALFDNDIFAIVNNSKIVPVKTEYPAKEAPLQTKRFDIAFIDIERPNEQPLYWSQFVNPAIEIKYFSTLPILNPAHKWADPISSYPEELTGLRRLDWDEALQYIVSLLHGDLEKLRLYKNQFGNENFVGLAILFTQFVPTGKSPDFLTIIKRINLKKGIHCAIVTPKAIYSVTPEKILEIFEKL